MSEFKLEFSAEPLSEMTEYIKQGFAIAFESTEGETTTCHHLYHNCGFTAVTSKSAKIIYMDFTNRKDLLEKWAKYKECSCELQEFCGNSTIEHGFCHVNVSDIANPTQVLDPQKL